jgi:hypothetical protein
MTFIWAHVGSTLKKYRGLVRMIEEAAQPTQFNRVILPPFW